MEENTVDKDCKAREQGKGRAARGTTKEEEASPGEKEDDERDGDALGEIEAEMAGENVEECIEKNVVGLWGEPEAGSGAVADELSKPDVVNV